MEDFKSYIGKVLDARYRLVRVIGSGGMAVVFEANDLLLHRKVAIKILRDNIAADSQAVRRMLNESKAVSMLSHPNIVTVYDVSVTGQLKYIVMEYIPGITLKNYMQKKGTLSTREVVSYTEQILRALQQAHAKGVIHRDIKPENIMLLRDGSIKVTDFGIAKIPNAETITMTDRAIGTVSYISPEQASGQVTDCRSDLYSVGAMMYEMACGKLPFEADSPVSVALKHINEQVTDPAQINPGIPRGLDQIILWAMEKDPEARFQSAEQMLKYLMKLKASYTTVFKNPPRGTSMSHRKKQNGRRQKSATMFPIIFGVFSALLVVCLISGIYLLSTVFLSGSSNAYQTIKIPSFIGETYSDEYRAELEEKYYKITVNYVYDKDSEPGTIIAQTPEAGVDRKVMEGKQKAKITWSVCAGVSDTVMPDYRAEKKDAVRISLLGAGYRITEYEIPDDLILKGYVVSTVPAAGEPVADGEMVFIYVSSGTSIERVTVPDFVGKTSLEAWHLLIDSNLKEGSVSYVPSDKPYGTVLSQSPGAGEQVPAGNSRISFVVSGGMTAAPVTTQTEEEESYYIDPITGEKVYSRYHQR